MNLLDPEVEARREVDLAAEAEITAKPEVKDEYIDSFD